jgi:nucleotide-binding universal stress UspA family protein
MYQRILVPTDGSPIAAVAAQAAIELAKAFGSEIVALSVAQPEPVVPLAEGAGVIAGPGPEALMEEAQKHVERVAHAAAKAGVKCTILACLGYSPADEIVDAAKRYGCDLIYIASHGRRGLSRLIAGSVTQRVLAYAPVPVMVFRPALATEGAGA